MNSCKLDKVNQKISNSSVELFEAMHTVVHLLRAQQYRVFANCPYELTHMEGQILCLISRRPGTTLSDLVAHSGRDKGQLARLIKTLRDHKLLVATEDTQDKRSVRLTLSPEGEKIHGVLVRELSEATEKCLRTISSADRTELLRLLHQLRANAEATK